MIGRIIGTLAGVAMAITGYGMLKPAVFARYFDFSKLSLGPFGEYKALVCWMIVAIGGVVVLAALQRPRGVGRRKPAPVSFSEEPAAHAPAASHGHGPLNLGPEPGLAAAETEDDDHDPSSDHEEVLDHQVGHPDIHKPEPAH